LPGSLSSSNEADFTVRRLKDHAEIEIADHHLLLSLVGDGESNLKTIEQSLGISAFQRGNIIILKGDSDAVESALELLKQARTLISRRGYLDSHEISYLIQRSSELGSVCTADEYLSECLVLPGRRHFIGPKSSGQKHYLDAIRAHTLTFAIGPAGTGKTYLAIATAVAALEAGEVRRLVLSRPAVEAGEHLGFLPGDLTEKVNPYLRPLYDALTDMMELARWQRLLERGTIEIAPLAFMRGRTLNDAFIIVDEAQNTTREQMKMLLTRLGFGSKAIVTGDITQVDLPVGRESGLIEIQRFIKGIPDIAFIYLTEKDVVRNPLVQKIVQAYEKYEISRTEKEEDEPR